MKVLGLGVTVGVATLLAGPVVSGTMMTVGSAVLLTGLADGTTRTAEHIAGSTAR